MKYFIIGSKAFTKKSGAETYCTSNGIDINDIIMTVQVRLNKFYELQTTSNMKSTGIFHNVFLTQEEINSPEWVEQIENFKSGEYTERFVHLKEIPQGEYDRMQA